VGQHGHASRLSYPVDDLRHRRPVPSNITRFPGSEKFPEGCVDVFDFADIDEMLRKMRASDIGISSDFPDSGEAFC
jgi:hypothetical protein